jgi:hypothetical protein
MRKFSKYFSLIISACLFLSCLTACGKPSPASLGIESPSVGGFMELGFHGLSVYGTGKINAANKTAQIEIESSKLPKIKIGDSVVLLNRTISRFDGTVSSIPDAKTVGNDTKCTIEVTLDYNGDDLSNSENIEMKATINLPAKDGVWLVDKRCIQEGNNDKQYVWASKKNPEELVINEEGWELVEVKTGETDGEDIEVTEGLKGFHTVYVGRKQ